MIGGASSIVHMWNSGAMIWSFVSLSPPPSRLYHFSKSPLGMLEIEIICGHVEETSMGLISWSIRCCNQHVDFHSRKSEFAAARRSRASRLSLKVFTMRKGAIGSSRRSVVSQIPRQRKLLFSDLIQSPNRQCHTAAGQSGAQCVYCQGWCIYRAFT